MKQPSKKNSTGSEKKKQVKPAKKPISEKAGKYGVLIVALFAFIIHFQTVFFGYTNCDDDLIISKHEYLSDFSNIGNTFSEPYFGGYYYRPLVIASFIVDANIGGNEAWVYHLFNVFYHVISCVGVFLLFRRLKYSSFISMAAGLIYAAHPIFTNSVSWILGRNDLLVGMFGIYSFIFMTLYLDKKKPLFLILHGVLLLCSALSKEAGLILPGAAFIYLWLVRKEKLLSSRNIYTAAVWAAVLLIWFFMKSSAVESAASEGDFAYVNFLKNIRQVPEIIARFIIPYNNFVLPTYQTSSLIIGIVLLAAGAAAVYFKKDKRINYISFGALWFFLFIFPGLFISIKGKPDYFDYLDTRMYLPMIGMLILILELIPSKFKSFGKPSYFAPYALIIAVLSVITIIHSKNYDNRYDFWSCAVEDDPGRARFRNQLGVYYMNKGENDKAAEEFLKAIELNPNEVSYYSKLGLNWYKQKRFDKALKIYRKGRTVDRYNSELNTNLSALYNDMQLYDSSIAVLRDALRSNKNMMSVLTNFVNAFTAKEKYDSAFKYANIQMQMGNPAGLADVYMQWGINLYKKGDYTAAQKKMEKAVEIRENYSTLNSLAAIQMINGMHSQAEKNLLKAYRMNPASSEVMSNLLRLYVYHLKDRTKAQQFVTEMKKKGVEIPPEVLRQMNIDS